MLDSKLFDHTILKADATEGQVQRVCAEARDHGFASVCVNSFYTAFVAEELRGSGVKTCTVVGFPLGQMSTRAKRMEAACAVEDGADEIDMVLNIAALKDGHDKVVLRDICEVREACGEDVVLKVIIETCLLSEEEKIRACHLAKKAGADFVKLFPAADMGPGYLKAVRAPLNHIKLMAVGGINEKNAGDFLAAGAAGVGVGGNLANRAWIEAGEFGKITAAASALVSAVAAFKK